MSDYERCGRGDDCGLPAGWGTDHVGSGACKHHGGASPGAPKGNDHAVGHGAPEGNTNAVRHELYAAESTYYQRRSETAREFIDTAYEGYAEKWDRVNDEPMTPGDGAMLFRCAIDIHKIVFKADEWETAKPDQLDSGHVMVDRSEKRSPQGQTYFEYVETAVHRAQHRLQQRTRMWLKDNNLLGASADESTTVNVNVADEIREVLRQ